MPDIFDEAESKFDVFDQVSQVETSLPKTTVGGAIARSAALSAIPSAAFGLGTRVTAPISAVATPWVGIPAGLVAGTGAGMTADYLQRKALETLAPEAAKELETLQAADVKQHPWASAAGRFLGSIGGFRLAPGKIFRQKPAQAATQIAAGTGIGVALPIATEALKTGELRAPTLPELAEAAAFPLVYGQPRLGGPRGAPAPRPERVTVTAEPPATPAEVEPVQIGRVESVGQKLLTDKPVEAAKEPVPAEQAPPPKEAPEAAGEVQVAAAGRSAAAPPPEAATEAVASQAPIEAEPVPEARPDRPSTERSRLIIDPYSTPMLERLDSVGGPVSRAVAAEGRQMDSRRAELIGSISPALDTAKRLAARAFRGGTTWIRQRGRVTPYAAIGRLHLLEGDRAAVVAMAPPRAQPMVGALWDANTPAIGGLAAQAHVGFAPSGLMQRIPTNRGMDTILEGGGTIWNRWVEGLAAANNRTIPEVQTILRNWKAELDQPVLDAAALDSIAQDFHRQLPRVITHVRIGPKWIELIESDPVRYLEKAAQRTASAVAFREVYPATPQGRQTLLATRQAVQAELPTNRYGNEFDNLINVLQGHRFDVSPKMFSTAAVRPAGALAAEVGGVISRPLRAGMLSLSAIANAAESVIGGPAIFMRFRHVLPLLTRNPRTFAAQLEMTGARDPNIRNLAFNPTAPAESVSRIISEGVNRVTLNSFMNEVQEYTGAGSAKIFADRVRANDLTTEEQRYFRNVLRAAGLRKNPEAIVEGRDPQGLAQFEREAATFFSGGHDRPALSSRWGNSRFFNALFWFHRYPQMVLNQFRGITNNLLEDARRRDWQSAYENGKLMAKFLGAKIAQGALANLFVTLIKEGFAGTDQKAREAKEAFGHFVVESAATGFGGPLAIAVRLGQRPIKRAEDLGVEALKTMAPVSATMDSINAIAAMGKYEGLDAFERAAQLLESKTPATPAIRSVAAIMGLAKDNPKLRTARNAFYRWTQQQGWKYPEGLSKDAQFHQGMRKTAQELEKGGDYKAELKKALIEKAATLKEKKQAGEPLKSASQSLSHRMILRNQFGGQLSPEEVKSLQAWLGKENFQTLQRRDAMVDALSDALK
jgi:hypothetical protein